MFDQYLNLRIKLLLIDFADLLQYLFNHYSYTKKCSNIKNELSNFLINLINSSMAKGSPGTELDSRLKIVSNYVINKDKGDAFSDALLDSILIKKEINKLVFVGLDLAYCVNITIKTVNNRKYEICIISDAVLSTSIL